MDITRLPVPYSTVWVIRLTVVIDAAFASEAKMFFIHYINPTRVWPVHVNHGPCVSSPHIIQLQSQKINLPALIEP